jgi:CHAT domain-containing protein
LVRTFFYAGARNLLASHWVVDDEVASKLTVRTIEIGNAGPSLSRAAAFQKAMRENRQNPNCDRVNGYGFEESWAHPNKWAPFSLIGAGR